MALELCTPGSEAEWLRSFPWSLPFRPRFFETDTLGHVNNVFYTAYLEMARMTIFRDFAHSPQSGSHFGFAHNAAELTIRFVRPCFFDEDLAIHTRFAALGRSSAQLEHAITSNGKTDIRTVARVAIVNMNADRPAPWTDEQRALLAPLVASA